MWRTEFIPRLGFKKWATVKEIEEPPHVTTMTTWCPHSPISVYTNTDHWSKLRVKAKKHCIRLVLEKLGSAEQGEDGGSDKKSDSYRAHLHHWLYDEQLQGIPDRSFMDSMTEWLGDRLPGIIAAQGRSKNVRRSWLKNRFQDDAREGYKFWFHDRREIKEEMTKKVHVPEFDA